MQCPIDKIEMEKGILPVETLNIAHPLIWTKGIKMFVRVKEGKKMIAYRCPKCGKVELTTEV